MAAVKKSFQREVKRLCEGNVYRKGALERAQALATLCDAYHRGVAAAYQVRVTSANYWVGPPNAIFAMDALRSCSTHADQYFREHTFGLGLGCKSAEDVAASYPDELAKASHFLQRWLP